MSRSDEDPARQRHRQGVSLATQVAWALIFLALAACGGPQPSKAERVSTDQAGKEGSPVDAEIELLGVLERRRTVGYRSPYRLEVTDGGSLARWGATGERVSVELRGEEERLDGLVGEAVRVRGRRTVLPGGKAEPGSEASERFLDGEVPTLEFLEVSGVSPAGEAPVVIETFSQANAHLGERVRFRGRAVRAKLAPAVHTDAFLVYCIDLDEWPDDVLDKAVEVTGIIERTDRYKARTDPDGAISQGTSGGDHVMRSVTYRTVE